MAHFEGLIMRFPMMSRSSHAMANSIRFVIYCGQCVSGTQACVNSKLLSILRCHVPALTGLI